MQFVWHTHPCLQGLSSVNQFIIGKETTGAPQERTDAVASCLHITMPRRPKKVKLHKKKVHVADYPFRWYIPGPSQCPPTLTALEAFFLLFNTHVIDEIIADTIRYTTQQGVKEFTFVPADFCTYVAILLAMCLHPAPKLRDYWSHEPLLNSPFIFNLMGRKRFEQIHTWLHFDILFVETQVSGIITHKQNQLTVENYYQVCKAFRRHWKPSRHVCIDEGMTPWKGRSKIRVFILNKPHPNGIKIYILCDASGYVYDFWIYRGKQLSTEHIVLNFAERLPGPGHIITFDAYYGGWDVAKELKRRRQYFIASCTGNRPTFVFSKKLHQELDSERGAWSWASYRCRILAVSWRDRKVLNLLTNFVDKPRVRDTRTIKGTEVNVPQVVELYRSTLNFVDRANAYRLRYPFRHRISKHTRVQWWTILMMAVVNAWILFKHVNNKKELKYRQYFIDLMKQLAEFSGSRRKAKRGSNIKTGAVHLPLHQAKRGCCVVCKVPGSCSTVCSGCRTASGGYVYLHHGKKVCFATYHGVKTG